jgi:hypothetical protein
MEASEDTAKGRPGPPKRFRTVAGVRRFVARVLADLESGREEDTDKARCMFFGAKLLAELIEAGELEKRVRALEARACAPRQERQQ